jgi:hypothetical protein
VTIQLDQFAFRQLGEVEEHGLLLPIFQSNCRNSSELASVVPDQRQVMSKGDGSNLQVVQPDPRSLPLERTTDLSAFHRARVIERQRRGPRIGGIDPASDRWSEKGRLLIS